MNIEIDRGRVWAVTWGGEKEAAGSGGGVVPGERHNPIMACSTLMRWM